MGRQLLFELLQDRAFFFLLNGLSRLSYKQVYKSRIDLIHYQISIAANDSLSSGIGMVFAHALLSREIRSSAFLC